MDGIVCRRASAEQFEGIVCPVVCISTPETAQFLGHYLRIQILF